MGLYLSYSGVTTYLDCSQKWWWGKQGWYEKEQPEALGLGIVFHESVAAYFNKLDPMVVYDKRIREVFKGTPGQDLLTIGPYMLGKLFWDEKFHKLSHQALELDLKKDIGDGVTLVGVVDFVGDLEGKKTVVDWKTSSNPYDVEYYNAMADQLVAYKILTDGTDYQSEQYGYCVVGKKELPAKQKDPQWLFLDSITEDRVNELKAKLKIVARRMKAFEHFKQPDERKCVPKGKWQPGCAFYELCLGKQPTRVTKDDF